MVPSTRWPMDTVAIIPVGDVFFPALKTTTCTADCVQGEESRKERRQMSIWGCGNVITGPGTSRHSHRTVKVVTWSPAAGLHHCNDLANTKRACSPTPATQTHWKVNHHTDPAAPKTISAVWFWEWNHTFKGFSSNSPFFAFLCWISPLKTFDTFRIQITSLTSCDVSVKMRQAPKPEYPVRGRHTRVTFRFLLLSKSINIYLNCLINTQISSRCFSAHTGWQADVTTGYLFVVRISGCKPHNAGSLLSAQENLALSFTLM